MTVIKTQLKPLNLNITLEKEVIDKIEPDKKTNVIVNPNNGRIIIGNRITAKEVKKHKETYTVTVMASVKGFFDVKDKKENLKELKILIKGTLWINKILENGEIKAQVNVTGEKLAEIKPLIIDVIKDIILQYKNSYEFFKRLRDDVDFYVKFENKENEKLLTKIEEFLKETEEEKEEDAPLP
jgi:hypothetical protein